MRIFQLLGFFLLATIIASCATIEESSNQFITFETPGAQDAKCYVYINKLRYQVFPPQTVNIKKSNKEMHVKCDAPGNRTVEIFVPALQSERAKWGTPVGMAWDYATESLHHYPSVIAVDFSQTHVKPFKQPKHNNADIKQPEEYDLEEFLPSKPRLNSDKNQVKTPIIRRGQAVPSEYREGYIEINPDDNKGNLTAAPSQVEPQAGEQTDMQGNASGSPVSLYPGQ